MKNYKQILEAVNRGIKFALDDFEDNELQGQTNSKVNNKSNLKEYLEWNRYLDLLFDQNVNADYFDKMTKLSEILNIHYVIEDRAKLNGIIKWVSMMCPNANLNWFDISKIDSLSYLFCSFGENFTGDISQWVVSNVKDMSEMFMNSKKFNGDISKWDVSKVENMCRMFSGAVSFDSDISKWDISNVVNMQQMFSASHFRQNISNWQINKQCNIDKMWYMSMQYDINKPPKTRLRYRR